MHHSPVCQLAIWVVIPIAVFCRLHNDYDMSVSSCNWNRQFIVLIQGTQDVSHHPQNPSCYWHFELSRKISKKPQQHFYPTRGSNSGPYDLSRISYPLNHHSVKCFYRISLRFYHFTQIYNINVILLYSCLTCDILFNRHIQ